jgi:hypothetical protein
MARRSDKVDAETGEIKKRCGKHVEVGFAGVASGGGDLPQLQGTTEELLEVLLGVTREIRQRTVRHEVLPIRRCQLKVLSEGDKFTVGETFTIAASRAQSEVKGFPLRVQRIVRTSVGTPFREIVWSLPIDDRPSSVARRKLNNHSWVLRGLTTLLESILQYVEHVITYRSCPQ